MFLIEFAVWQLGTEVFSRTESVRMKTGTYVVE